MSDCRYFTVFWIISREEVQEQMKKSSGVLAQWEDRMHKVSYELVLCTRLSFKCYECHLVAVTGFAGGESGSAKAKGKDFKKRR